MKKRILCFLIVVFACAPFAGVSANPLAKGAKKSIEFAMKKFSKGRALTPGAQKALEETLENVAKRHGDDVFKLVEKGGVELIEQGAKHGDDLWRLAVRYPQAARALALHGDELLPLVRKAGPEVLEIEARNPGLATRAIAAFGDDGARSLAKAQSGHVPVLVGYAEKADSPATRRLLLETYEKSANKTKFLEAFNWKTVLAAGVSASAVIAAYQISDGVQNEKFLIGEGKKEGLKTVATENPAVFKDIMNEKSPMQRGWDFLTMSLAALIGLAGTAILAFGGLFLFRLGRWVWNKAKPQTPIPAKPETPTRTESAAPAEAAGRRTAPSPEQP